MSGRRALGLEVSYVLAGGTWGPSQMFVSEGPGPGYVELTLPHAIARLGPESSRDLALELCRLLSIPLKSTFPS
jgi:hypothetical protein